VTLKACVPKVIYLCGSLLYLIGRNNKRVNFGYIQEEKQARNKSRIIDEDRVEIPLIFFEDERSLIDNGHRLTTRRVKKASGR
jgi:hypothetical protein